MVSSKVQKYLDKVQDAVNRKDSELIVDLLDFNKTFSSWSNAWSSDQELQHKDYVERTLQEPGWSDVMVSYGRFCHKLVSSAEDEAFEYHLNYAKSFNRVAVTQSGWVLGTLRQNALVLQHLALNSAKESRRAKFESFTNVVNEMFKMCINDRSTSLGVGDECSKVQAAYPFANQLLAAYFKLRSYHLAESVMSILKSLSQRLPSFSCQEQWEQSKFLYMRGVLEFMAQKYQQSAETHLSCLKRIPVKFLNQRQKVLLYLIPAVILSHGKFPSAKLWEMYPALQKKLYTICSTCRSGNLRAFNQAIEAQRSFLIRHNIYFAMFQTSLICVTHLISVLWKLEKESNTISLNKIRGALEFTGHFEPFSNISTEIETSIVTGLVCTLISKQKLRATVDHEKKLLVLLKDPFVMKDMITARP